MSLTPEARDSQGAAASATGAPGSPPSSNNGIITDTRPDIVSATEPAAPSPASPSHTNQRGMFVGMSIAAIGGVLLCLHAFGGSVPAPTPAPPPVIETTLHAPVPGAVREEVQRQDAGMFGIWVVHTTVTLPGSYHVSQYQQDLKATTVDGCQIVDFTRTDAAGALMGMQKGDVIVAYDGVSVQTIQDICAIHSRHHAGDVVPVQVLRQGALVSLTGRLGTVPLIGGLAP